MPATAHLGRSLLSFKRDQVHAMDSSLDSDCNLENFQKLVADRFHELSGVAADDLLSLSWVRKLLDVFLSSLEDFRVIMSHGRFQVHKPPLDRMVSDFHERSVKALDVCNAIRDGIEQIRQWEKLLEIVLCALDGNHRMLGEGHFRRAKKALVDLAIAMLDEKDSASTLAHRNRSFGRNNNGGSSSKDHPHRSLGHFRSLSWSVSRSWSAAKQLNAIGGNLTAPRGNEIVTTGGLAVPIYTIGCVLLFVMWALVAALPCQDRGLQVHFYFPKQFSWAAPMLSLQERIMEEAKRRDRKNACALMKEILQMEKCSRVLSELSDSVQLPLTEDKEMEVRQRVKELAQVLDVVKEGLDPLERQVREVFHRIVRSRTEGLDSSHSASR